MISKKAKSAIIITAGSLSGYLIARQLGEDKIVGLLLGGLAGTMTDEAIKNYSQTQTIED